MAFTFKQFKLHSNIAIYLAKKHSKRKSKFLWRILFFVSSVFSVSVGCHGWCRTNVTHQVWQGQLSLATFDIRQRIYPNQTWCWSKGLGSLVTRLWKEIEFSSKTLRVQQGKSERLLENGWTQTWQGRFVPWQDCLINTIHEAVIRSVLIATNI